MSLKSKYPYIHSNNVNLPVVLMTLSVTTFNVFARYDTDLLLDNIILN